jgi:hypothetical protein
MLLVGLDIPLHNVLVVGSCVTLLVLSLVQILLCLFLHLYTHLDLCVVRCTEVPDYTLWDYIVVVHYYTTTVHYCILVVDYYMVVVPS